MWKKAYKKYLKNNNITDDSVLNSCLDLTKEWVEVAIEQNPHIYNPGELLKWIMTYSHGAVDANVVKTLLVQQIPKPKPMVGVGLVVLKDNKILLGKRKGSHAEGCWSCPGGHVEFGETPEETCIREVREEFNINVKNIKQSTYQTHIFPDVNKHYITLYLISEYDYGEAKIMEPDKCSEFGWFALDKLPAPLFPKLDEYINGVDFYKSYFKAE
jgi:8-oxo-dGTP diphosphatase